MSGRKQGRETVEVVRPGALTTVQDFGRPGFAHLGVPASGAMDSTACARANRLVGNVESAAVLESTVDGVGLRFDEAAVIAVTGAAAPVWVDGRASDWSLPVYVTAGSEVEVGPAEVGVRSYLAVAGGFEVPSDSGQPVDRPAVGARASRPFRRAAARYRPRSAPAAGHRLCSLPVALEQPGPAAPPRPAARLADGTGRDRLICSVVPGLPAEQPHSLAPGRPATWTPRRRGTPERGHRMGLGAASQ